MKKKSVTSRRAARSTSASARAGYIASIESREATKVSPTQPRYPATVRAKPGIAPPSDDISRAVLPSIIGTGSYVPDAVITNEHLQNRFNCDKEWIVKQTGIRERRHALANQATTDLGFEAARRCIANAGARPQDIDMLLVATITPDMSFPSTA